MDYGKAKNLEEQIKDNCYDPTLITRSKALHIQIISAIFPLPVISADYGK
jgi:hypothetical protein